MRSARLRTMTDRPVDVVMVSHTHWDREWYRTFEAFRARLVDTVDRVLDLLDDDPGWSFLLDGQAIVIEDYLAVRPDRRAELEHAVRAGRLAMGPGTCSRTRCCRRVSLTCGTCWKGAGWRSRWARLGRRLHARLVRPSRAVPAAVRRLRAGTVRLLARQRQRDRRPAARYTAGWRPTATSVLAYHLGRGYFAAACLPREPTRRPKAWPGCSDRARRHDGAPVMLMNGIDHMLPDAHTGAVAERWPTHRRRRVPRPARRPREGHRRVRPRDVPGELIGARVANLLPGVWSARLGLKLEIARPSRRCSAGPSRGWRWAQRSACPTNARRCTSAWRALLQNQAHDSICGCSQDEVHRQMHGRFATATELAEQTTGAVLERSPASGPSGGCRGSTELDSRCSTPRRSRAPTWSASRSTAAPYLCRTCTQDIHP